MALYGRCSILLLLSNLLPPPFTTRSINPLKGKKSLNGTLKNRFQNVVKVLKYVPVLLKQNGESHRGLGFSPVIRFRTLPPPTIGRRVCPLPLWFRGGTFSLAGRGWGGPNSDEWTDTVVLQVYMYVLCVRDAHF